MKGYAIWLVFLCLAYLRSYVHAQKITNIVTSATGSTTKPKAKTTKSTEVLATKFETKSADAKASSNLIDLIRKNDKYVAISLGLPVDDSFFVVNITVGNEDIGLRLDLIQPEIWVMNKNNFFDCDYIADWWSAEKSKYGSSFVAQESTASEFSASVCGQEGLYSNPTGSSNLPTPTKANIYNGQPYMVPYLGFLNASGEFATNNISFITPNEEKVTLKDFTFINADDTNVYVGGLGLAGDPTGSGFLDALVSNRIIKSPGYSLWFNNYTAQEDAAGQLILGAVDKKFYSGDFFAFDIPSLEGSPYPNNIQNIVDNMQLPIIPLDDFEAENLNTGDTLSLKSDEEALPILLDPRSLFNFLPLYMIVNLAIQTNATFSNDVDRWIVECDRLVNLNATLNFKIGGLTVKMPLNKFVINATYSDKDLKFSDGSKACYLNFLPSSASGYNSLGLDFLKAIYLAVDNEGGKIAIANSNSQLDVKRSDFETSDKIEEYPTSLLDESYSETESQTTEKSFAYIESGTIPFATTYNRTQNLTFTYSPFNYSSFGYPSLPAGFLGAVIKSGEVFITQANKYTSNTIPGAGNPGSTSTSRAKSYGNMIKPPAAFGGLPKELFAVSLGIIMCIIGIVLL